MVLCFDISSKRHVPEIPSFLWLKITPLYLDHILFIHSSVDGHWVISIYWLLWITSLSTLVYESLLESQLLILLGICPGGELLDCMIVLCLTFWGTDELFHGGDPILYFYQQCMKVPIFPHPCQKHGERVLLYPSHLKKNNILMGINLIIFMLNTLNNCM